MVAASTTDNDKSRQLFCKHATPLMSSLNAFLQSLDKDGQTNAPNFVILEEPTTATL